MLHARFRVLPRIAIAACTASAQGKTGSMAPLAGSFLGPFFWGLYSGRVSKAAVWASFIIGVGLTTGNMVMGFFGAPLIASPINCGAIAMVLSFVVVPVVSLFTPSVPFDVVPVHGEGAIDREYVKEHLQD